VLIGAPGHDIPAAGFIPAALNTGAAYLFDAASGALLRTITNPLPRDGDRFGQATAVLGSDPVVSAPGHLTGAVYRLDATTGQIKHTYLPQGAFGDDAFGLSLAISGGDKIVVGAPFGNIPAQASAGVAQMFDAATGTVLQTISKGTPVQGDEFGYALASSGSFIVVGAPRDDTVEVDSGAIYFFPDNSCGNGVVDGTEQCDDGNLVSSDGCDGNCSLTSCGNGVVTAPEQCDDGNNVAGDGCSPICGLEGACGDGIVSSFEQCDDGNVVSGDGCDSNCKVTGCGNGIAAGSEQCDAGAANGIDLCCSSSCQLLDADHDSVCDRDDVCPNTPDTAQSNLDGDIFGDACDICPSDTNNDSDGDGFCIGATFNPPAFGGDDSCSRAGDAGAWTKPKALLLRLGAPFGDDGMRLKGIFSVGNLLPMIQPDLHGVHVRVTDRNGRIVMDETIDGGPISGLRGWKAIGSPPNQWVFTDRAKPPLRNGISKIIIRNRAFVDPKVFSIALQGNSGTYPLLPGDEPIQVTFELNANALPRGGTPGRDQCGEIRFSQTDKPSCKFVKYKLICR
jgi:cysteine-rich repeat protein